MKRSKIGLTGGIGSGKSVAADILRDFGAYIVDADIVAREVVEPDSVGAELVRREFGDGFFDDGILNRRRLREFVFLDSARVARLNGIMHGLIQERILADMVAARAEVVVAVVPLLVDCGWQSMFDEVWYVSAAQEARINRVINRDNTDREATLAIINAQVSDEQRAALCDVEISNNGDFEALRRSLAWHWKRVLEM